MFSIIITTPAGGEKREDIDPSRLAGDGVILGRSPRSGVHVDDPSVSRSHARFILRDGAVMIEDVGSSAGTSLNGRRLVPRQPTRLSPNDKLTIGPCVLLVAEPPPQLLEEDITATLMGEPSLNSYLPLAGLDPAAMPRWTGGEIPVRVVRVIDETHDVKTFAFASESPTLYHYLPGQFMTLHLTIEGKPVRRSYTISSSPSRPHLLTVTVKRVPPADGHPPGLVSNWLHDHIQVGDTLTVSGPFGDFTCAKFPSPRLLLVSGGSGITPMLSMARWLTDTHATADTVFLHGARSSRDLVAQQELAHLANHNQHLRLIVITSRPEPGSSWLGISGRLTIDLLAQAVPDFNARRAFCCGPAPFMTSFKEMLAKSGFAMERYHEESFGAPKRSAPAPAASGAPAAAAATGPKSANSPTPAYGLAAIMRGLTGDRSDKGEKGEKGEKGTDKVAVGERKSAVAAPSPAGDGVLTCVKSKKSVPCSAGTPILEALEGAGMSWPSGCRMGKCGMCKVKVTVGALDRAGYEDGILSPADRGAGFVLTCIGKPAGAMTLEA